MEEELRPYGPRGAWVCFDCVMESKNREEETSMNFLGQAETSILVGPLKTIIGEVVGTYQTENNPGLNYLVEKDD